MTPRDVALAALVMALWGFNFVAAKIAVAVFPPVFLMTMRFLLVALFLSPFLRRVPPRRQLAGIALLSLLLGTVHFPLMFTGLHGLDAATAAIASQLQVPFSSLLAALFLKDYLGWRRALGMAVAFAGIVVIAGAPRMQGSLLSLGMVIGAGFAFAVSTLLIKRIGSIEAFSLNAWMALCAVPPLAVLTLSVESGQAAGVQAAGLLEWLSLLYIAVGSSVIAHGMWYRLARVYPVNQTAPFLLLVPVFGVLSGVLALGEPVSQSLAIGGALTLAGVAVIMVRRPRSVDERQASTT